MNILGRAPNHSNLPHVVHRGDGVRRELDESIKRFMTYAVDMMRDIASVVGPRQFGLLLLGLAMIGVGVAGLLGKI